MILGCFFFDMKASTYVSFSHGRDGYLVWLSRRVSHNSVLWHTTKFMDTALCQLHAATQTLLSSEVTLSVACLQVQR